MSNLWSLIQGLLPHFTTPEERDEAYLCESVDQYDLERRMYELDHRDTRALMGGAWSFGTN